MSSAGATTTGLAEMRASVDRLPQDVTAKLRAIAWRTSRRVMEGMQRRLTHQDNPPLHAVKTAASVHVIEEADRKQFVVLVPGDPDRPRNLPMWLEHGTVHMRARPFQKPTEMEVEPQHQQEMVAAANAAVTEVLT